MFRKRDEIDSTSRYHPPPRGGCRLGFGGLLVDFTLHSSDKADTPSEVFKVRFYELCDRFKNFYDIYTDGPEMGHRVSAALCHKRGTLSVRLPGATSIFNAELHAILLALNVV